MTVMGPSPGITRSILMLESPLLFMNAAVIREPCKTCHRHVEHMSLTLPPSVQTYRDVTGVRESLTRVISVRFFLRIDGLDNLSAILRRHLLKSPLMVRLLTIASSPCDLF